MQILHSYLNEVDQHVGEIGALARSIIYMAESAEPAERDRLRPSAVTMLYLMQDRADHASRAIGAMAALAEKQASCGKIKPYLAAWCRMFPMRSRRAKP